MISLDRLSIGDPVTVGDQTGQALAFGYGELSNFILVAYYTGTSEWVPVRFVKRSLEAAPVGPRGRGHRCRGVGID